MSIYIKLKKCDSFDILYPVFLISLNWKQSTSQNSSHDVTCTRIPVCYVVDFTLMFSKLHKPRCAVLCCASTPCNNESICNVPSPTSPLNHRPIHWIIFITIHCVMAVNHHVCIEAVEISEREHSQREHTPTLSGSHFHVACGFRKSLPLGPMAPPVPTRPFVSKVRRSD